MKAAILAAVSAIVIRVGKKHPAHKQHLAHVRADPETEAEPEAESTTEAPAPETKVHKHHDKYNATNEYDTDYAVEKLKGGYDVTPVDNFSQKEDAALPTPLDGEALVKEIDAQALNKELNEEDGAGIKDYKDLKDMLGSIKGSEVFINRTPRTQLYGPHWKAYKAAEGAEGAEAADSTAEATDASATTNTGNQGDSTTGDATSP